jgi:hypothetical protein
MNFQNKFKIWNLELRFYKLINWKSWKNFKSSHAIQFQVIKDLIQISLKFQMLFIY